jgi:hypothetical protein
MGNCDSMCLSKRKVGETPNQGITKDELNILLYEGCK